MSRKKRPGAVRFKPPREHRIIVGLMSGTSHDSVDAALVSIRGVGPGAAVKLIRHSKTPFTKSLRKEISDAPEGPAHKICSLGFRLGRVFAGAALAIIRDAGMNPSDVHAIASHGQTICHIPPRGKRPGSTMQIGEPAVIARMTGILVVSDFRAQDMAEGGQGAPLVPYADYVLFRDEKNIRALQNIGGISNVTVVTPAIEDLYAFDTGPGNCLIDEAMRLFFEKPFDRGGKTASGGRADESLIRKFLGHGYFGKRPPKSTGRETFGMRFLEAALGKGLSPKDAVATFTHFTARSIRDAYERFVFPRHVPKEMIVSGGGTKNEFLMSLLRGLFSPMPVLPSESLGMPSSAKEAVSFAVLANETLSGRPSNLPNATGAKKTVVLGRLTPP